MVDKHFECSSMFYSATTTEKKSLEKATTTTRIARTYSYKG